MILAKAHALQSMLAMGVYSMRRTCNGYATGSHCGQEACDLCQVLGVHRDLESLIAQSDVSNSPSGKNELIGFLIGRVILVLSLCRLSRVF